MKKSKLFLFGLIAVLAGSLVLSGCENASGVGKGEPGKDGTGTTLDNERELAQFGYTLGQPVLTTVGRDAVHTSGIVGLIEVKDTDTITNDSQFTFYDGTNSLTLPLPDDFLKDLDTASTGLNALLTANGVNLVVSIDSNKHFKVAPKTTATTYVEVTGEAAEL